MQLCGIFVNTFVWCALFRSCVPCFISPVLFSVAPTVSYPEHCFVPWGLFRTLSTVLYPEHCFVRGICRAVFRAKRWCAVSLAGTPGIIATGQRPQKYFLSMLGYSVDETANIVQKSCIMQSFQQIQTWWSHSGQKQKHQKSGSQSDAFYPWVTLWRARNALASPVSLIT